MTDYLDISLTISPGLPYWPGSSRTELSRRDMVRGDASTTARSIAGHILLFRHKTIKPTERPPP